MKLLNDETFHEAVSAPQSVVMFTADWAGPCHLIRPSFEYLAERHGDAVLFAEFNVDDNPETPSMYGVRALPLFLALKDGHPVGMKTGAMYEDELATILDGML